MSFLGDIAKTIGPIAANFVVPGSGPLLHRIMRGITGDDEGVSIEEVEQKIAGDPQMLMQFKTAVLEHEAKLAAITLEGKKVDAQVLETVNVTMREEGKSEHWPQWAWRPFNGFLYGITIFCTYFILPLNDLTIPSVPTEIWIGWGAVLGITTWHRGKQKRTSAGEQRDGALVGLVKTIKGGG